MKFAILRLVDGVSNRMMQSAFESSYLSMVCKDIATSENSLRNFITILGGREAEMDAYMKSFIMPKSSLLFDGTTIFCNGTDEWIVSSIQKKTEDIMEKMGVVLLRKF